MNADKDPEFLAAAQSALLGFRDALLEFLELHVFNDSFARGLAPAVFPKDDADRDEIRRLRAVVSRAAGRARDAARIAGIRMGVQGISGSVDPVTAWASMTDPKPLVEPTHVLDATEQMIGHLDTLILRAKAEAPPELGPASMHPLIWAAARQLWRNNHYQQAVGTAAEVLISHIRAMTGRNDVPATALWQEVFSNQEPRPGAPRLRWPGSPADLDVKTMQDGLRQFAPGVQMLIRNPASHSHAELTEQGGIERLAALSLLATWVEACELMTADPVIDDGGTN